MKYLIEQSTIQKLLNSYDVFEMSGEVNSVQQLQIQSKREVLNYIVNNSKHVTDDKDLEALQVSAKYELTYLLDKVSQYTGVSPNDIRGKERKAEIIFARHLFCYCADKYGYNPKNALITLKYIGDFVNKDHATIIFSKRQIKEAIDVKDSRGIQAIKFINTLV